MILIADDDPIYTQGLLEILDRAGYKDVKDVATGEKVISSVKEQSAPDVLILDMMLPWTENDINGAIPPKQAEDLRGLRVIQELSETGFDMSRIIVITAYYVPQTADLLRAKGVKHIFFKPALVREILHSVRTVYVRARPQP